jgi:hypothetical protein
MPEDFLTEGRASARPIFAKQGMQKHVPPDTQGPGANIPFIFLLGRGITMRSLLRHDA